MFSYGSGKTEQCLAMGVARLDGVWLWEWRDSVVGL